MSLFYQVDCSVASSGKRIAVTKRRVRWRWGTANNDALANGDTGFQCRGFEHEVILVWSITSGKRLVLLDGKEIHFSTGRRTEGKFQYSWAAPETGNHVITLTAYAAAPLKATPGFKQFDLAINGQSCSDMTRIYELGVQRNHTKSRELTVHANVQYDAVVHPPSREEEMKWAQRVIKLEQKRDMNYAGSPPATRSHSLRVDVPQKRDMNYAGSTPTTRSQSLRVDVPQREMNPVVHRSTSVPFAPDFLSESHATVNNRDFLSESRPIDDNYCQTSSDDEFNPNTPPTYEAIWSSIMDAYDSGGTNGTNQVDSLAVETEVRRTTETTLNNINPVPVYPTPIHQAQTENTHHEYGSTSAPVYPAPIYHIQIENTHHEYGSTRGHTNGIHHDSGVLHVQTENIDYDSQNVQAQLKNVHNKNGVVSPHGVNGIDGAMQNLVNLDDILSPVFSTTLTMNPSVKREKMANRSINSRGLPPKMGSSGQIGHPLTLLELKEMQGNENVNPAREVMNVHTHYAAEQNPVALVIYNQQQQYNNYSHMCR